MKLTCPVCHKDNEIEKEVLPYGVFDDTEYQCEHCASEMRIGWIAEIEVMEITKNALKG